MITQQDATEIIEQLDSCVTIGRQFVARQASLQAELHQAHQETDAARADARRLRIALWVYELDNQTRLGTT